MYDGNLLTHDEQMDGSVYGYFLVFLEVLSSPYMPTHLEKMLKLCEDTNLALNWEKSHFMVKEGIVLGHKISKSGIEVDQAKIDVIAKLPHPTTVKVALITLFNNGLKAKALPTNEYARYLSPGIEVKGGFSKQERPVVVCYIPTREGRGLGTDIQKEQKTKPITE
ncbi:hypothetical protein Tco_0463136 [Tanacetum coccineum]